MLDTKLSKIGSILIHNGKIELEGFEAEHCMCREVAAHALLWAIGLMQQELTALIAKPSGDNTSMDFSKDLRDLLKIETDF